MVVIVAETIFACSGQFFSIPASLYHGTPVTTAVESQQPHEPPHCSRLLRCFIEGGGQEKQSIRQNLRVIAGVRTLTSDPKVLSVADVEACINACPTDTQYDATRVDIHTVLQKLGSRRCERSRRRLNITTPKGRTES